MSDTPNTHVSSTDALVPAANFFSIGSELLGEVQKTVGDSKVKALRITVGNHVLREIPVTPVTAIATIAVVVAAILISNLKVEVVKEPLGNASPAAARGGDS